MVANLGSVGVTREALRSPNPRVDPDAFGVGVGRGLRNMAGALVEYDNSVESLKDAEAMVGRAYKQKQDKLARARADVDLVRMNAEIDRGIIEASRKFPDRAARGFTDTVEASTREVTQKFLAGLSEELRNEYGSRVESIYQDAINKGFNFEVEAQDLAYRTDYAELVQGAVDSIASGRATQDEWIGQIETYLQSSPLVEAATEELRQTALEAIQTAEFSETARMAALNPDYARGSTGGPADGKDVVAAGLPGPVRGLLNIIAKGESPGYNVMNGGGTFSDYSDHPRTRGPSGKSTAAGRYQIIAGTWDRAQRALNLPDFSPESQDRAAVWIAQEDYRARTGRDLMRDLNSGNFAVIENIKRVLGGNGDANVTWKALQGIGSEEFYKAVTEGTATPSSLMDNPRYSNLSRDKKLALLADANNYANSIRDQEQSQREAALAASINQIKFGIADGTAGMQDVLDLRNSNPLLSADDYNSLVASVEKRDADTISVAQFGANVQNDAYVFNPNSTEDKKGYDLFYQKQVAPAIAQMDSETVQNTLLPLLKRTGFLPELAQQQLLMMAKSNNPEQARFGLETVAAIKSVSSAAFAKMDDDLQSDAIFYQQMADVVSPDELMAALKLRRDPVTAQAMTVAMDEIKVIRKDNASDFNPERMAKKLGAENFIDPTAMTTFDSEFNRIYEFEYTRYRDHKLARNATLERLKTKWGNTAANGQFMKLPPENYYPVFNGTHDYLGEQVREAYGDKQVMLVPDATTAREIDAGQPPSYSVMTRDERGFWTVATSPAYDAFGGVAAMRQERIYFEISPQMQMDLIDKVDWERNVNLLSRDLADLNEGIMAEEATFSPNTQAIQEMRDEMAKVERDLQQLKERRPKLPSAMYDPTDPDMP